MAVKKLKNTAASSEAALELHRELDIMKCKDHTKSIVKVDKVLLISYLLKPKMTFIGFKEI